jgi:hypothetical protein
MIQRRRSAHPSLCFAPPTPSWRWQPYRLAGAGIIKRHCEVKTSSVQASLTRAYAFHKLSRLLARFEPCRYSNPCPPRLHGV